MTMSESRSSMQRSPHTPSHIPVIIPRPAQSSLPSSLSLPQLSLVSSSRRVSGNNTPVHASPGPTSSSTNGVQTPGSAVPSFRSLRNLLAFGPNKSQSSDPTALGATNGPKSPFATFGSVRRSITIERKKSNTYSRPEEKEQSPVILIDASPKLERRMEETGDIETNSCDSFHAILGRTTVEKAPSSPGPAGGTDLSTIIEAENSGISKHIPEIYDSQDAGFDSGLSPDSHRIISSQSSREPIDFGMLHAARTPGISMRRQASDSEDTSALDLSTSKLAAEVMDAMKAEDQSGPSEWLKGVNGIVVDDALEPAVPSLRVNIGHSDTDNADLDRNLSFNLSALDPDLAALLSPNRVVNNNSVIGAVDSITPPPLTPARTSPGSPSSSDGLSASRTVGSESSPSRRRSTSLSRPNPYRPPPSSSLPRLARSVTGLLSPRQSSKDIGTASVQTSPVRTSFDESARRASSDSVSRRPRPQPPSPLSAQGHSMVTRQNGAGGEDAARRPSQSRLVTPSRHASSSHTPASSRPPLRHATTALPSTWEADSVSPSSRAPSSIGAATTRRLHNPRESAERPRTASRERTQVLRNRKRSMSVDEHSPGSTSPYQSPPSSIRPSSSMSGPRPATEWLGPRTAKAFAAAGLLDFDRDDRSGGGVAPRFGAPRSVSERDARYTPSRTAFSEASGSNVSWGRSRSASRTMTVSEAGHALTGSPTFSTPRTTFSAASTAPTSVSAASSVQHQLQSTLQIMKEKHDVETEALLSALSDSQRTTKVLRDENSELRERIQDLERQLDDANNYIRRLESPPLPLAHTLPRRTIDRITRMGSADGPQKRSQLRMEFFNPSDRDPSPEPPLSPESEGGGTASVAPSKHVKTSSNPHQRRLSTTSSVFPLLPSNMSLLMQEEGNISDRSGGMSTRSVSPSPPSPTLVLPKQTGNINRDHHLSMSSENISPTTASFTMTEMTGSPRSLYLRPEHEMHLGDMTSFDLQLGDDPENEGG